MFDKRIEIIYRVLDLIMDDYFECERSEKKSEKEQAELIADSITYIKESLDHLDFLIDRRRF
jgi:hypothetical protein